jgi:hypothetical protein
MGAMELSLMAASMVLLAAMWAVLLTLARARQADAPSADGYLQSRASGPLTR